ncbi:hypothetical protein BDZ97DRAFT_1692186 [Flammula alnicola]|nr:hypothetical protein BDZ97DRAFT_1692186 [Flammula alnicola]
MDSAEPLPENKYEDKVLDLHDVALLLNYERGSTEPRFRYTKLREVATTSDFKSIILPVPEWTEAAVPRIGFVFDRKQPSTQEERDEPDLPSNILPNPIPPDLRSNLAQLTPKELETYYWQARNHDGCFKAITLFQHFVDLFPEFTRVRVRTVEGKDKTRNYTTLADDRMIVEIRFFHPTSVSVSAVFPDNKTYITGSEPSSLHAVLGFAAPGSKLDTILDLASLQFGDVGRGSKGNSLFVLEPIFQYAARLDKFAQGNDLQEAKLSQRIRDSTTPDNDWLKTVAQRAKDRWEKRATVPWCGHCGAPPKGQVLKTCAKCKSAWYCDPGHQLAAWPFHKHFCNDGKT